MMKPILFVLTPLFLFSTNINAALVTYDFEDGLDPDFMSFTGSAGVLYNTFYDENYIGTTISYEDYTITFDTPVILVGFDYTPSYHGQVGGDLTITGFDEHGVELFSEFYSNTNPFAPAYHEWRTVDTQLMPGEAVKTIQITQNGTFNTGIDNMLIEMNPVPVPAAAWLFGSGLLGLVGVARRKRAA